MNKKSLAMLFAGLTLSILSLGLARESFGATQAKDQREVRLSKGGVRSLPGSAKRYALIIGVDQYNDAGISNLEGAANDARALEQALIKHAGFSKEQVTLLTTDQPAALQPTRSNILSKLDYLLSAVSKDGLILISFSGHGIEREGQAYLLPTDAQIGGNKLWLLEQTAIPAETLTKQVRQSGAQQVVIILDACRNNPEAGRGIGGQPMTEAYTRGFNFDIRNGGIEAFAILYATRVGQMAYENKEKKQGYFSLALIEGLKGAAVDDRAEVTLASLVRYVQEVVPRRVQLELGKEQKPFAVKEGFKEDELVLAVVEKPASRPAANSSANSAASPNYLPLAYEAVEKAVDKLNKSDFEGAIEDYKFAIRIDPDNASEYKKRLAEVYAVRGQARYHQGNYEGALADLSIAIEISPNNALFYNNRGVMRGLKGEYEKAIADYTKAIEIDPRSPEAYKNRAMAYDYKGQKEKAKQDYDMAKQIDPDFAIPGSKVERNSEAMAKAASLISSANKKVNKGDFDGAIDDYTGAIQLNPKSATPYYLRAIAKAGKEYFVGFLQDYKAAYDNGARKIDGEDYKRFTAEFSQEIESNPKNAIAYMNRALLRIFKGDKKKALNDINQAITIDPNLYVAYGVKALSEDSDKKALADIDRAIRIKPTGASAYMIRYIILLGNRRMKEAESDLEQVTRYSPPGDVDFLTLMIRRFIIEGDGSAFDFLPH
ncbi:MAG TPA: tetratricopeptide repeat protein [Blastocatellia bacterium]|nr:tetratricopeptide repeat protein [Blastocatellia bacterium]